MTAAALPRPSDRFIPLYIVAFFAVFMTVLLTMVYISLRSYPGIVTENSYEKGLAMNKYIAASAAQQALGWKGDLVVGPLVQQQVALTFTLRDEAGAPLSGAKVTAWLVRPAQEGLDQKQDMKAGPNGTYSVTLPVPQAGSWEARVAATVGHKNFQMTKRLKLF